MAYIQRIVVKSLIEIPTATQHSNGSSGNLNLNDSSSRLYLIDAFRAPLAQLFELNEFIRNFQTTTSSVRPNEHETKSLVSDLCVHVSELAKKVRAPPQPRSHHQQQQQQQQYSSSSSDFNKHLLPEFNCLYLSPANLWSNDLSQFVNDDDLLATLAQVAQSSSSSDASGSEDNQSTTTSSSSGGFISSLVDFIYSMFQSKSKCLNSLIISRKI